MRVSRPVLRAAGGEIPPAYSPGIKSSLLKYQQSQIKLIMSDASKRFVIHQHPPTFLVMYPRWPHVAAKSCGHWRRGVLPLDGRRCRKASVLAL